jgi:hypothetical protein
MLAAGSTTSAARNKASSSVGALNALPRIASAGDLLRAVPHMRIASTATARTDLVAPGRIPPALRPRPYNATNNGTATLAAVDVDTHQRGVLEVGPGLAPGERDVRILDNIPLLDFFTGVATVRAVYW